MSGALIGIGVGPGNPELITVEGRDALLRADAIFDDPGTHGRSHLHDDGHAHGHGEGHAHVHGNRHDCGHEEQHEQAVGAAPAPAGTTERS